MSTSKKTGALAVAAALCLAGGCDGDKKSDKGEEAEQDREREAIVEELGPNEEGDADAPKGDGNDTAKGATPGVKGQQERPGEVR